MKIQDMSQANITTLFCAKTTAETHGHDGAITELRPEDTPYRRPIFTTGIRSDEVDPESCHTHTHRSSDEGGKNHGHTIRTDLRRL